VGDAVSIADDVDAHEYRRKGGKCERQSKVSESRFRHWDLPFRPIE
jgi:hypothetical protein